MSNIIQIKHGAGAPGRNLAPYELGYATDTKTLYIGGALEGNEYGDAIQLTQPVQPSILLIKLRSYTMPKEMGEATWVLGDNGPERIWPRFLRLVFSNLQEDGEYVLRLYTRQKHRGSACEPWRHPNDYIPASELNNPQNWRGKIVGYKNLSELPYVCREEGFSSTWPECPDWMPNGGVLQTEWEIEQTNGKGELLLNLSQWCLDLLKPFVFSQGVTTDDSRWGLIGIKKLHSAAREFKFSLYDNKTQKEYFSDEILAIGQVSFFPDIPQYISKEDAEDDGKTTDNRLPLIQYVAIR